MQVAILDDWFDTLRTLACYEKLAGHTVTVFTDHVQDTDILAERLSDFDALVLIRASTCGWCAKPEASSPATTCGG